LARITGPPRKGTLTVPQELDLQKLEDGLIVICPKCGAGSPADEELLKKF
jgi:hypothetical protein